MAILVFDESSGGKRFEIKQGITTLGREPTNTLYIEDAKASREHCVMWQTGGQYFIKDLGSSNGTFVNGKRISGETVLNSKDVIRIGHTKLTFQKDDTQEDNGSLKPSKSGLKVIARFVDGKMIKGYVNDFDRGRDSFHITPVGETSGERTSKILLKELKAVFFVRDFEGKVKGKELPQTREDRKFSVEETVEVELIDGEVIVGKTLTYEESDKEQGFFVIPNDPTGNNDKIFIINSSVKRITPIGTPKADSNDAEPAKKIDISSLTKEAEDYIKRLEGQGM